jgi:hypothetical protein
VQPLPQTFRDGGLVTHALLGEKGARFSVFQCEAESIERAIAAVDEFLAVVGEGLAAWDSRSGRAPCVAVPAMGTLLGRHAQRSSSLSRSSDDDEQELQLAVERLLAIMADGAAAHGIHVVFVCPAVTLEGTSVAGDAAHYARFPVHAPFVLAQQSLSGNAAAMFPRLAERDIEAIGHIVTIAGGDASADPPAMDLWIGEEVCWGGSLFFLAAV